MRTFYNHLHIFLALCIFFTSCRDPRTVQIETPTVDVVQQLDDTDVADESAEAETADDATSDAPQPTATTAQEDSAQANPTNTPQPTNTAAPSEQPTNTPPPTNASSGSTTRISPEPLAPLPMDGVLEEGSADVTFDELVQRANALAPLVQALRNSIDRSQFDLLALLTAHDFEAEVLNDFVRDEITFEQYDGVLRGAEGTLIGRAGNALDQSLLLSTLLNDAGYEARIAHGTLTTDQATSLVEQMAMPRPAQPPAGDEAMIDELIGEIIALDGISAEQRAQLEELLAATPATDDPLLTATASDTAFILDALDQAGITLGDSALITALTEAARDYYWVEYRLNAFDEWQSAHPAFNHTAAPDVAVEDTFNEPSADLFHRIRFEVYVEQKINDQLIVNPIVTDIESTTANLVGNPFSYQNQPNNLSIDTAADPTGLINDASIFLPTINGDFAGNAFDLDGRYFGLDLLALDSIGATQLFQTQARQIEEALGTIDNLGNPITDTTRPDDYITLTAQWMEYTIITPDGTETTQRRYVIDRIGVENRAAEIAEITDPTELNELAKSLLSSYTFMVMPARYNAAYTIERSAERTLAAIAAINQYADNPDSTAIPDIDLKTDQDYMLNEIFEAGLSADTFSYRPETLWVVYEEGVVPDTETPRFYERTDVIHNTRYTFATGDSLQIAPEQTIAQGVWETATEQVARKYVAESEFNTMIAFREADANILVLHPDDAATVATLAHSELTRANIAEDLAAGYVVVVPESAMTDGRSGWWRIDPTDGTTLGITTGGYGTSYSEYTIGLAINHVFFVAGFARCTLGGGNAFCCYIMGATFSAGFGGIGAAIASATSKAVAAIFALGVGGTMFGAGATGALCGG